MSKSLGYRREIDGLRAIAVVPVILFHAGFNVFGGGYVGVDIFFVISGFLITAILIYELEQGDFSIVRFYERRARRILPALFFVMFACLPFAYIWMWPSELKAFAQSLVAVVAFSSNILFWKESGYFAATAELKPLLHTWSLAVEEQYYLLFPVFLLLSWRFGRQRVFWALIAIALVSFVMAEWVWTDRPNANFYLAPTRAWELLAGSVCAFLTVGQEQRTSNGLSVLGLTMIVFSIFVYDSSTPFPSAYTLMPVVGTALIILFAGQGTWVARMLSLRAFVGVGLISYSAYLWHQPLFAFARIRSLTEPSVYLMAGLAVAALFLAWATWHFVEKPFRNPKNPILRSRRILFLTSGATGAVLLLVGFAGHVNDGFVNLNDVSFEASLNDPFYVMGDSHAGHLTNGLERATKGAVIDMSSLGCIPFRDVDRSDARFEVGNCARTMNSFLDRLASIDEESYVVLSSMGPVYLDGTPFMGKDLARVNGNEVKLISNPAISGHYQVFEYGMRTTLSELTANEKLTVIFAMDVPELGIDMGCGANQKVLSLFSLQLPDFTSYRNIPPASCRITRQNYESRAGSYRKMVNEVLADFPDVELFDPSQYMCDTEYCYGYLKDYGYLYTDVDHLSVFGSIFIAERLSEHLARRSQ